MAIPHIGSVLNALLKGGPPLPNPHNTSWGIDHRERHDGGGKDFPLGIGRPDHPHGGPPGHGRPDHPHGGPPGIGRPDQLQPGNGTPPGFDRPGLGPGQPPGADRPGPGHTPGQGLVRDIVGLLPGQQPPAAVPGHPHGQAHGPPSLQLPAPALANAQAQQAPAPPATQAQPLQGGGPALAAAAATVAAPLQAGLQQVPVAGAPRADAAQQVAQAALPGQAARADVAQALPPRAEAAPAPRADAATAERQAMLQRAAAAPMPLATQATVVAHPAAANQAALSAAAAAGTTMASAPVATQAVNQAADSRGVNLVAADRAQVVGRSDIAGTYTGEGPYRRGLRRAVKALPGGLSGLLMAFGAQGHAGGAGRDPGAVERELRAALMQWLFWLLAVIAYGCIAFAVIGLLPSGSLGGALPSAAGSRAWAGGFALAGLVAGVGAWWFARGMARDSGGQDGRAPGVRGDDAPD